ncbi:MAG TPA: DEAD/DEAH box helicase [Opitutales bacterium]|nr:DEAD/DEAH box helicase [Opitutales bacterium]
MHAKLKPYLHDVDHRLVIQLAYWEKRDEPVAVLAGLQTGDLLKAIVDTGRAFLRDGNRLRLQWGEERQAEPQWRITGEDEWQPTFTVQPAADLLIASQPPCYFDREANVAGGLRTPFSPALAGSWLNAKPMKQKEAHAFCVRLMNRFSDEQIPSPETNLATDSEQIPPKIQLRILPRNKVETLTPGRAYSMNELALAELTFGYGPRTIDWNSDVETIAFEENGQIRRCTRDRKAEKEALAKLHALGLQAGTTDDGFLPFEQGHFELNPSGPLSWNDLLKTEFPKLRRKDGWKISHHRTFDLVTVADQDWFRQVKRTKEDWFSFEAGIRYRGQRIQVLPILRQFLRDHPHKSREKLIETCRQTSFTVLLADGKFLILPGERIAELLQLVFEINIAGSDSSAIRISALRASELADSEIVEVDENDLTKRLRRLRHETTDGLRIEPLENLPPLPVSPRRYQQHGLAWLNFLREYNLGGILADDMGLGKTMQVLIHILHEKTEGRLSGPCLIVAPTSVLDSWENERERFTPDLTLLRFHGPERETPQNGFAAFDLVLTSYALTYRDRNLLADEPWELIVLDEAQRIKNASSETARALFSYRSKRRLCLSGTPMENHLGELWSLFHFLMPGFLGDRRTFDKTIRQPAEGEDDDLAREIAEHLALRLRPFFLRRKKETVASELPPRTEITRLIPLSTRQTELYESIRLRLHRQLVPELEKRGIAASQIEIFSALLKLRQTCCDPRLLDENYDFTADDSAKLLFLMEMLDDLVEEGRTILIFSQFVQMLHLIARELEKKSYPFLKLTGATENRGELIQRFQAGEAPIFLISLKAGGTGLTLTAADTVIQYDPWWNVAAEQQAADRAHRIGQDKPVFHYRLIMKGTIEEKILHLQQRKQTLVDSILEGIPASRTLIDKETFEALFTEIDDS